MKQSGRNIRRRLYSLTLIGNRFSRAKHFRGHGVHSPYVYTLVRKVFMKNSLNSNTDISLYNTLIQSGISQKRAIQLQNMMHHIAADSYSINDSLCDKSFNILTSEYPASEFGPIFDNAVRNKTTLVIMQPYADKNRTEHCLSLILQHNSTSVDNRGYIIFFNNHLPKQHYRL